MAFILNIETAIDTASIALAQDGRIIYYDENTERQSHSSWLHPAIQSALKATETPMQLLNAVAVSNGPGSYTGLRIGLSAAKGICYALHIPLIALNTLTLLAGAVQNDTASYICPMIDARRMDVFTAVYNKSLETIIPPAAITLTPDSFSDLLQDAPVVFTGNGSEKFTNLIRNANAIYQPSVLNAKLMPGFSEISFTKEEFANIAYAEPFYTKSVFITKKLNK